MPTTRRSDALVAALLALLVAAVFGQSVGFGFIAIDDAFYVTGNSHVARGLTGEGVRWALTSLEASNWHPLTWISHMLDVSVYGLSPGGHHLTSVLLHAANAALLYALLRAMTGARGRSAVVAALFAAHPLRAESVVWVAQRKDVLSAFFGLLALLLWLGHLRRPGALRYTLALVAFALGLAAKPVLVTLPCLLLLLDWWPLARLRAGAGTPGGSRPARLLLEKAPFLAAAAAASALTYRAQEIGGSIDPYPLAARLSNAAVSYARYLGMAAWPAGLSVFYPHRDGAWPAAVTAAAVALLLAVSAVVLLRRRREPWLATGWLWYLGTLVPMAGFVQVGGQALADRYTYLPLIGVAVAAVWSAGALVERRPALRPASAAASALLVAALSTAGWLQARLWGDERQLLEHSARAAPGSWVAHGTLAVVLARRGDAAGAEEQFRRAIAANPDYFGAQANYALFLYRHGRFAEAREHGVRAASLSREAAEGFGLPGLLAAIERQLAAGGGRRP
jgi:tetratricopeptide (TPR) repeat protein